jgi:hypothetical protein
MYVSANEEIFTPPLWCNSPESLICCFALPLRTDHHPYGHGEAAPLDHVPHIPSGLLRLPGRPGPAGNLRCRLPTRHRQVVQPRRGSPCHPRRRQRPRFLPG